MQNSFSRAASALLGYLSGWPEKPAEVWLGRYGEGVPALRLLPATGARELKRYADGTAVYALHFSLSLRTRGDFPLGLLSSLENYLQNGELPYLGEELYPLALEICDSPQRTASDVSGLAEYTLPLRLTFAQRPDLTEGGEP